MECPTGYDDIDMKYRKKAELVRGFIHIRAMLYISIDGADKKSNKIVQILILDN